MIARLFVLIGRFESWHEGFVDEVEGLLERREVSERGMEGWKRNVSVLILGVEV